MVATAQRFSELYPSIKIVWEKRSLQEFADKPIAELSEEYDLLVIDHPWAGFAAASGVLEALDSWMPEGFLKDQEAHSVGQSFASYGYEGNQWALPIDAAAPVSAYRQDLLEEAGLNLPRTWSDLIEVGRRGLLACSSIPLDVYGNFLNLCVSDGAAIFPDKEIAVEREAGLSALERLREMMSYIPDQFFDLNPIAVLEGMSREDAFAYNPYVYGYSNYSRVGYAPKLVSFGEVISVQEELPGSTMLGGTGLAISASCAHKKEAADYAAFVAGPETQKGMFFYSGGQPGHRAAWQDERSNELTSDFFAATLPVLDRAFVRPRYAGYLNFQDNAGYPIHQFLREGGRPENVLESLNRLYRESSEI